MPHVTLSGLLSFDESLFFHRPSRTLIVADLLMNAKAPKTAPLGTQLGYKVFGLDGSLAVFPLLRWVGFTSRRSMRASARIVLEWRPESLVVGHGMPISTRSRCSFATHSHGCHRVAYCNNGIAQIQRARAKSPLRLQRQRTSNPLPQVQRTAIFPKSSSKIPRCHDL